MKRIVFAALAALAIVACQKTEPATQHLTLDLSINHPGSTKAVKTGWESGDKIVAVFDNNVATTDKLELTFDGTTWAPTWSAGLEEALITKGSGTVSALFVPNAETYKGEKDGYSPGYIFHKALDTNGDPVYAYGLTVENAAYSISGGKLTATLDFKTDDDDYWVHLFIDGISGTNYTLSCEKIKAATFGAFDGLGGIHISGNVDVIPGYPIGTGVEFSGFLTDPETEVNYNFTLTDTKGTADTADDEIWVLTGGEKTLTFKDAFTLPALGNWYKSK